MNPNYNHEHLMHRIGWLRAAMLGANDGIISVASLLFGLLASGADVAHVLLAGFAALVAGATSMAAGEWVSVMSQVDAERAELELERQHILDNPESELLELQYIYEQRGLSPELAQQVARALTAHDVVGSHARDELGISPNYSARPMQAALASALSFLAGGIWPLLLMAALTLRDFAVVGLASSALFWTLGVGTVLMLFISGEVVARLSNTKPWRPGLRVAFWGAMSMGFSTAAGWALGVVF